MAYTRLKRPNYIGTENILTHYDLLNKEGDKYYSVWASNHDIAFQCTLDDPDQARQMLEDNIKFLEQQECDDVLHLKMHPNTVQGFITAKTPILSTSAISPFQYEPETGISGPGSNDRPGHIPYATWQMMESLKDLPAKIDERVKAIVEEKFKELEPEEEEPEPLDKAMGIINGITSNPKLMEIITGLFSLLKPQAAAPTQPLIINRSIGMADQTNTQEAPQAQRVPFDEQAMNDALNVLSYHCDLGTCLGKLAHIAQTRPDYFKMLLSMLMNS